MNTRTPAAEKVAADSSASLQPAEVADTDLAPFEATAAAQHLGRLEADRDLVLELGLHGYKGPGWDRFAEALAEYGFQVVAAWVSSGLIFIKCVFRPIVITDSDGL